MTKEEMDSKLSQLEQEYSLNRKQIIKDFCDYNNPYKIGDIFTDHIGSIKIERIKYSFSNLRDKPCCVYHGIELKKDLTPKKLVIKRDAWQSNEIKK